tara:strand:+ start:62 stop:289 length:228 start_codon:yes stop_codon:yes gene_type:complete
MFGEYIIYGAIGIPLLIIFGYILIMIMLGPIAAFEKIKKIFKIKEDSNLDNFLTVIVCFVIIGIIYLIFDSGLLF